MSIGGVKLKRSKALSMDKATTSVDSQTDAVTQKIIREDFEDCTLQPASKAIALWAISSRICQSLFSTISNSSAYSKI